MRPPPVTVRVHPPMGRRSPSPSVSSMNNLNYELFKIETSRLPELKQELGLIHKDLLSMTYVEKVCIFIRNDSFAFYSSPPVATHC